MLSKGVLTLLGLTSTLLLVMLLVLLGSGDALPASQNPRGAGGAAADFPVAPGALAQGVLARGAQRAAAHAVTGPVHAVAEEVVLEQIPPWNDPNVIAQPSCTLEITTTDKAPTGNDSFLTAATIANYTEQSLLEGDQDETVDTWTDYYRLDNARVGARYSVQAKPDWTNNYNLGMIVYNSAQQPIITDTNTFDNNYAAVSLVAENNGPYYFTIFQISEQCSGHTYSLILSSATPTPTPSNTPTATPTRTPTPQPTVPTPVPTWLTGFDAYEPNFNFDTSTTIAPGLTYDLNFIPWGGADVDNDFFKIRIKQGLQVTCETSDLDPGVDPRMVFYTGPAEGYFLTANDDITLGDFNSRISYVSTYEGYLYILVGQGQRMETQDTVNSDYSLTCEMTVPAAPTPLPGYTPGAPYTPPAGYTPPADKDPVVYPTSTPRPANTPTPTTPTSPVATPTLTPTPEPAGERTLTFRLIAEPVSPTPSPEPNGFRTFRVLVYYDANMDGQMGAGEGVSGFYVLVLSSSGQSELAQGYTDEQGQLSFTVPTVSTVRVLIPLLGVDRLVEASQPEVKVRILPPLLPDTVP